MHARRLFRVANPAPAQQTLALVADGSLTGGDGALRLGEAEFGPGIREQVQHGWLSAGAVTQFYGHGMAFTGR